MWSGWLCGTPLLLHTDAHAYKAVSLTHSPPPCPPPHITQLSVQGYSEKLPVLLDLLLDSLAAFTVKPDRFAVMAEAAGREYANVAFQQVYQWAMYRAEVRGGHLGGGGAGAERACAQGRGAGRQQHPKQ